MLIYKLLGDKAQNEFARSWGISYGACAELGRYVSPPRIAAAHGLSMRALSGMNVAVEWKDVLIESMKGAVILALLERFYVTKAASWFEDHIGACAVLDWRAAVVC